MYEFNRKPKSKIKVKVKICCNKKWGKTIMDKTKTFFSSDKIRFIFYSRGLQLHLARGQKHHK